MAPTIEIGNRGMTVGEELHEFLAKRSSKLDRYIHGIQTIRVDVSHNKNARDANDRFKSQITVLGSGFVLRAEERADDIRTAYDSAYSKIQSRISRYKGKRFKHKGDGHSLAEAAIADDEPVELDEEL